MAKKWYALKFKEGESKLLYDEWSNISQIVEGTKGLTFKAFFKESDANDWLSKSTISFREPDQGYNPDEIYVFVDGSYSQVRLCSGWGWVAVLNGEILSEGWGVVENVKGSRNIIGELRAATESIKWAISNKKESVTLVHDYAGIGNLALGYWKGTSEVAVQYIEFIRSISDRISLKFEKVNGHCGIKWNEYADELTRRYQLEEES